MVYGYNYGAGPPPAPQPAPQPAAYAPAPMPAPAVNWDAIFRDYLSRMPSAPPSPGGMPGGNMYQPGMQDPAMPPGVTVSKPTPRPSTPRPLPFDRKGLKRFFKRSSIADFDRKRNRGGGQGGGKKPGISQYKMDILRSQMPWMDTQGINRRNVRKYFTGMKPRHIKAPSTFGRGRR